MAVMSLTLVTFLFPEHVVFMIKTGATTMLCVSFMNYLFLHNWSEWRSWR